MPKMDKLLVFLHKLGSPKSFYAWSGRALPWFVIIGGILFAYGLFAGLVLAPPDYQQGDAFRIIYVHVPAAFMSLFIYSMIATCALIHLVWRVKLMDVMMQVSAPIGAWMTFLALFTGAIWGKPMWGIWWIWDARLTSELILLFLYLGLIALRQAIIEPQQASRAVAMLALIGFVNIPIIHYSVYWWNTLHQGATIAKFAQPSIANDMLYPLLAMMMAFFCYFIGLMMMRARSEVLWRERRTRWIRKLIRD